MRREGMRREGMRSEWMGMKRRDMWQVAVLTNSKQRSEELFVY
jgi:hypothetical protein